MAEDCKKLKDKDRPEFRSFLDAKLRFFWMCWAMLLVICCASLTLSVIALQTARNFHNKAPSLLLSDSSSSSSPQEPVISTIPSDKSEIVHSHTIDERYEVLTHNLTVLSKKYMKMFRSMKEMLDDHEKSPTGHASGSIKVELDKLREDFNNVLKKYVKRKGNKFLKITNYDKSSAQIRSMMQRLDTVVSDLLQQVQLKIGLA